MQKKHQAYWMGCERETDGSDDNETDYPVKTICEVLALPRSTFYHTPFVAEDGDLQAALLDLFGQYPTYGYRRLTALLKRAG